MGSISVGSSSRARELFTRFDTGQRCRISLAAGLEQRGRTIVHHDLIA